MIYYAPQQIEYLRTRWHGHNEAIRALIPILKTDSFWYQSDKYKTLISSLAPLPKDIPKSQRDLRGIPLIDADLQGSNLSLADLSGADLDSANLSQVNLKDAVLLETFLEEANLFRAVLEGADLQRTKLAGANLSRARLWNANLQGSNLEGANLEGAHLWHTNLSYAFLGGVNFCGAYLREANLSFSSLSSANLQGADLMLANLNSIEIGQNVKWNAKHKRWASIRAKLKKKKLAPEHQITRFGGNDIRNANWAAAALLKQFVEDEIFIIEYKAKEGFYNKLISFFWKWSSDYGRNLERWMLLALCVAIFFGLLLYTIRDQLAIADHNEAPKLATAIYTSIVIFTTLGFGDVSPKTLLAECVVVIEVIIGYIMLGGLISIFSNRFARRG
ncbi:MAG: pentapeptide repeat-containing protein [Candidatus Latescibacteria bacterium]|nr:pentapeptide repeat-containing protein [Candidatus Latescibacterota bacterium]